MIVKVFCFRADTHMPWGILFLLDLADRPDVLILLYSQGLQTPGPSRISEEQPQDTSLLDHDFSRLCPLSAFLCSSLPTSYVSTLLPTGLSISGIKVPKVTEHEHEQV